MNRLVATGLCLVLGVELLLFLVPQRDAVMLAAGGVAAAVIVGVRWSLEQGQRARSAASEEEPGQGLRRWLSRTETLIERSESTRAEWDRHLRPMLARQFEMATGQRRSKDARAFGATGRVLFGEDLWRWVDPDNVSRAGPVEPGPGRDALNEILQRLERV